MYFKELLVSETGDIDSMVSILEGYFENISHDERIDKGYPTKIVWVNCENILDEMNDGTKTRRDSIMKLLPCGYDYVTPEVLEKWGFQRNGEWYLRIPLSDEKEGVDGSDFFFKQNIHDVVFKVS